MKLSFMAFSLSLEAKLRGEFMENPLTTGSVWKNILTFSLPYLCSYFLQTLYGMADLFIIGQYEGPASITGVAIGSQVMHMLTVMIVGLAMGTTVNIGQAVGAGDKKKAGQIIGNTVTLFMALSVVAAVILTLSVDRITSAMSTPVEAVEGAKDYLTICFIGIPAITAYNIISSIFRGMDNSKSPMYFVAVACAANILLDILFMGPMHMGPAGAALGTTLSQTISVLISLAMIRRSDMGISVGREDFTIHREVLKKILRIGVPVAIQDGFIQISFLTITAIANGRGLIDAAAVGIVEKIISFIFLVPSSMLSTVSALGAINIGAGKEDRARQILWDAIKLVSAFGVVIAIIVEFTAPHWVAMFTGDAQVIHAGGEYFQGYIFDAFFAGIHFSFSGYFCAIGRSELSFLHNAIAIVTARLPLAYLASNMFPETLLPMGLATALGSLESALICALLYLRLVKKGH